MTKSPRVFQYLAVATVLALAFPSVYADDNQKKTTKAPPKKSAAKPAPANGSATTGESKTAQPVDTNSGHPAGKRIYEPAIAAPPPKATGTGGGPSGSPATQYDSNRGAVSGRRAHEAVAAAPSVPVHTWQGSSGSARLGSDGSVRQVTTHDMTIVHAPGGARHIVVQRPNHTTIVTNGAGHGYVQQPFTFRGHDYARRTYYVQGHTYVSYYRSYSFRNVALVTYTPVHYYSPVFYGWAYHPWVRPVAYAGWGWYGTPWYSYYGGYFAPSPYYPSAAFWLTDFMIAASLQAAYQQQLDAQATVQAPAYPPSQGGAVALTPDVKQAIADEVQRQLALENSEGQQAAQNVEPDPASSGLPRMLGDGASHVFVVANPLDVSDSTGQSCSVSEGDVLQLQAPPPQDASAASLFVLASKNQDCPKGAVVTVAFSDLQDMQNQMRATIDSGLDQLHAQSGKGGLPPAPPAAAAPPTPSAFAPIAPPPDPNAASELSQQAEAANAADQQVISEANASGGR